MTSATKTRKVAPLSPATQETAASPDAKRKPVATLRVSDCSASIWAREYPVQGTPKTFYSVTLERSYKDRDGTWKYTKSFDVDALGAVVSLCQQAEETIRSLQQEAAR